MDSIFEVELPDGSILEIEAPANTTPEAIKARARKHVFNQKPKSVRGGKPMAESQSSRVAPSTFKSRVSDAIDFQKENWKAFGTNAAHHLGNIPVGIAETQAALEQWGGDLFGVDTPRADLLKQAVQQRQADYQANPYGAENNSPGAWSGAIGGAVAPWMIPQTGLPKLLSTAGRASEIVPAVKYAPGVGNTLLRLASKTGQRAVGGAAQGAVSTPFMPSGNGSKLEQLAWNTWLGAAIPVVGAGIAPAVKWTSDYIFRPSIEAGRRLADKFGIDETLLPLLQNAREYYPGHVRTTAESLAGSPVSAKAGATQKELGNRPAFATAEEEMRVGNDSAAADVIRNIAGTPEEQAAALAAREAATGPYYQQYVNNPSKNQRYGNALDAIEAVKGKRMSSGEFANMESAQSIIKRVMSGKMDEATAAKELQAIQTKSQTGRKAVGQAEASISENMAKGTGLLKFVTDGTKAVPDTIKALASLVLKDLENHVNEAGRIPTKKLHEIKESLNKKIFDMKKGGATFNRDEYAWINQLQTRIANALEKNAPGYKANNRRYAELSGPINTQKAAQNIIDDSINGSNAALNSSHQARITPSLINKYLSKDDRVRYGMSQEARDALEGIQRAGRESAGTASALKRSGSDTDLNAFSSLLSKYGKGALSTGGGATLGATFGGAPGLVGGALLGGGLGALESRVGSLMAKGTYDSKEAAKMIQAYLKRYPPAEREKALLKYPAIRAVMAQQATQNQE